MTEQIDDRKPAKRKRIRSPENCHVSLSLDRLTLQQLDAAANQTGRTRSNMVRLLIRRALPAVNDFTGINIK